MSMNMDPDPGVQYADHDRQIIAANLDVEPGVDADTVTDVEPVGSRGIDPDEIAQLVALRRVAVVGGGEYEVDLSVNGSFDEFPTQAPSNIQPGAELDVVEGSPALTELANYTEIGSLDSAILGPNGVSEETQVSEFFINFSEEYGSGPYLDANDDLTLHLEAGGALGREVQARVIYELMWSVEEMDESIPRFSRR